MLKIVETLDISWSAGNIIHDYLTGEAWWAWTIDGIFLGIGLMSGGVAALMKTAIKVGLKQAIKGLTKRAAIML